MPASKISAIIPAHNVAPWLRQAVESCLAQTLRPDEIVIVDDASRDGTYALAEELAAQFAEVRALRNTANRGPSATRNRGVRESRGEYLAFLDADDFWFPAKLERQMAVMQARPELGLAYTAVQKVRADGRKIRELHFPKVKSREQLVIDLFVFRFNKFTSTLLFTRKAFETIGGLDERLERCEDHDFFMRIAAGFEVEYLDEVLVNSRVAPASFSHSGSPLLIETPYRRFMEASLVRYPYLQPHAGLFQAKLDFQIGRRFQKQLDTAAAREYFSRSFRLRPSFKTGLAWLAAALPKSWQNRIEAEPGLAGGIAITER